MKTPYDFTDNSNNSMVNAYIPEVLFDVLNFRNEYFKLLKYEEMKSLVERKPTFVYKFEGFLQFHEEGS